jgi:integrin alpha FG-GAP repeat containing protein 1
MKDRDGTMDIIFPTCFRHSSSTGLGHDCSINIAFNQQVPTCSSESSKFGADGKITCRGHGDMCRSDPDYAFDFASPEVSSSNSIYLEESTDIQSLLSIPLSSILPSSGDPQLLLHVPGEPNIPLPLRPGDFNVDGFPDLLLTIHNSTAAPGVITRKAGHQVRVLENVPCGNDIAGCEGRNKGRGFISGGGSGWEVLDDIWDASGASWLDVDDDVRLTISVCKHADE